MQHTLQKSFSWTSLEQLRCKFTMAFLTRIGGISSLIILHPSCSYQGSVCQYSPNVVGSVLSFGCSAPVVRCLAGVQRLLFRTSAQNTAKRRDHINQSRQSRCWSIHQHTVDLLVVLRKCRPLQPFSKPSHYRTHVLIVPGAAKAERSLV